LNTLLKRETKRKGDWGEDFGEEMNV